VGGGWEGGTKIFLIYQREADRVFEQAHGKLDFIIEEAKIFKK